MAAHYMALNEPLHGRSSGRGGRIVVTASDAGLWALPVVPQYTATKHALVGMVRALAPSAAEVGVSINAVAPALTPSNLAPPGLLENYPKEALTKMETLMKAFDALGRFDQVETEGWGSQQPNGQVVEGRGDEIHYKNEIEKTGGREVPRGESVVVWCVRRTLILSRDTTNLGRYVQRAEQEICDAASVVEKALYSCYQERQALDSGPCRRYQVIACRCGGSRCLMQSPSSLCISMSGTSSDWTCIVQKAKRRCSELCVCKDISGETTSEHCRFVRGLLLLYTFDFRL